MKFQRTLRLLLAAVGFCAAASGCVARTGLLALSNVVGIKPVVIAVVSDDPLKLFNPFSAYDPLRQALSDEIRRPVALDTCVPLQMAGLLKEGFYQFAIVSPIDYARLPERDFFPVLAAPSDAQTRRTRFAFLVVPWNSPIQSVEELRGKLIAFGPAGNPITHKAALALLERAGINEIDVGKELLPVPGALRHVPIARALAQSLLSGASAAGFIDNADWESLPEQSPNDTEPSRRRLRVLARTASMPTSFIVASPKADPAMVDALRTALLAMHVKKPDVLRPLNAASFFEPTTDEISAALQVSAAPPGDSAGGR